MSEVLRALQDSPGDGTLRDGVPDPEAEATFRRGAHAAAEALRASLTVQAEELRLALREVARVNAANRLLTERSLVRARRFFRMLRGAGVPGRTD